MCTFVTPDSWNESPSKLSLLFTCLHKFLTLRTRRTPRCIHDGAEARPTRTRKIPPPHSPRRHSNRPPSPRPHHPPSSRPTLPSRSTWCAAAAPYASLHVLLAFGLAATLIGVVYLVSRVSGQQTAPGDELRTRLASQDGQSAAVTTGAEGDDSPQSTQDLTIFVCGQTALLCSRALGA